MEREKCRCSKCGAFEVTYVEASANPFGEKKGKFVCQRCGQEYPGDSGINVINHKTINTFPNPNKDLAFTKKFKPKINHNTINTFPNPNKDLEVDNPFTSKMKEKFKKEVD